MVISCLAVNAVNWFVNGSRKNPFTTPMCVPIGKPLVGNWHFKSLSPSFAPVKGSATSDTEHVPEPLLFVFTNSSTDSTVSLRGCCNSDKASTLISVEASQFGSLKIAIVTLASVPRLIVFGNGALG